jgi:hypothetical protein
MNSYIIKSSITGMPDYTVKQPLKPLRLQLEPHEALILYVTLEKAVTSLNQQNAPDELVELMTEITDKLYDKLEVTFHERAH